MNSTQTFFDAGEVFKETYPQASVEEHIIANSFPSLSTNIISKMVEYAGEVRRLFMGEMSPTSALSPQSFTGMAACEVTLSTRILMRWADLTVRFQPLTNQGIQPTTYALDRALGFRAPKESRAMLHELAQCMFTERWKCIVCCVYYFNH